MDPGRSGLVHVREGVKMVVASLIATSVLALLYVLSRHDYLLFHTLVEFLSIAVAAGAFMVFWNARQFLSHGYFLFLGVTLVFVAALDMAHLLTYKGMPFADQDANAPTQLWIAARYFQAMSFLMAPLFLRRRLHLGALLIAGAAVVALLLAAVLYWKVFPRCFVEGIGLTPFKIASEYVICLILAVSIVILVRRRAEFDAHVFRLLVAAVGTTIVAEVAFTFYISAYGASNFAGHVLKVVAFYLLYRAMIEMSLRKPYQLLFRELKQTVERLRLLSHVSEQLLASPAPGVVTERLCHDVMRHLDCQVFFRYHIDEEQDRLVLAARGGDTRHGNGDLGWLDCRSAACGGPSRSECRILQGGLAATAGPVLDAKRDLGLQAHACHPLMNQGRMVGAIAFGSRSKSRFELDEMALLKAVSDQVAIATQRVRLLQTAQERAAEAQAANEAKSRFLANISHELRTPLGAILGMTELALADDLNPTVRDYLATTKESADGLLELLNELLDFSRMEAGKFELDEAPFSLRSLVEQTAKTMGVRAYEKGLELVCDLPQDVPDALVGDRKRLRQILVNLVGNAIKFTAQGEVVVQARLKSRADQAVVLELAVEDTGIGIKPEDRGRIFSPFTQADASTSGQYGGTGLGLAIAANLVELMSGQIAVESPPGRGSRFFFTAKLGLQPSWAESPDMTLDGLPLLRGAGVLIVDDNPASRRILEQVLARWEMKPEVATDAPGALAAIHKASAAGSPFAVVIVDATIPGTDGFTLVQWLKNDPGLVGAAILMVSVADRRSYGPRCQETGAVLLDKPISQSGLFNALIQALGKSLPPAPAQCEGPLPPPARLLRILVAEDTPANQKLVSRVLGNRGHSVEVVVNGRDAVTRLEREEFDVILMDVQMPTMDGFQATAAIRALADLRKARVPVIAMTAHAMKGDQERCLQAGMDSYLAKPINVRELAEAVERYAGTDISPSTP